jgi:hypothetical protein
VSGRCFTEVTHARIKTSLVSGIGLRCRRFWRGTSSRRAPGASTRFGSFAEGQGYPNGRDPNVPQGLEPSTPNPKAIELVNQKALRADIAKLYEMASDLKNEIDKTDPASTLSVTVVKKAQQIEKLASKSRN